MIFLISTYKLTVELTSSHKLNKCVLCFSWEIVTIVNNLCLTEKQKTTGKKIVTTLIIITCKGRPTISIVSTHSAERSLAPRFKSTIDILNWEMIDENKLRMSELELLNDEGD